MGIRLFDESHYAVDAVSVLCLIEKNSGHPSNNMLSSNPIRPFRRLRRIIARCKFRLRTTQKEHVKERHQPITNFVCDTRAADSLQYSNITCLIFRSFVHCWCCEHPTHTHITVLLCYIYIQCANGRYVRFGPFFRRGPYLKF